MLIPPVSRHERGSLKCGIKFTKIKAGAEAPNSEEFTLVGGPYTCGPAAAQNDDRAGHEVNSFRLVSA